MRALHNTALTALFSTFRLGHLHKPSVSMPCDYRILKALPKTSKPYPLGYLRAVSLQYRHSLVANEMGCRITYDSPFIF